ncbi:MAG: DUF4255 domain-containing protein [Pseudomonadota bacterium]
MANALAIAGVTAVLKDLLNDGLINANIDAIGQFSVTSVPLDEMEPPQDASQINRLNIYMWNATRNAAWSNERLPGRNAAGARIDSPYLALDLHFVLSATGSQELNAEILLGFGMQVLHETPLLTRDAIGAALGGLTPPVDAQLLPAAQQFLQASDLADQFEQIRITPAVLDNDRPGQIEALSNIWSAFSTSLRASALYQVSCVLIESQTPVSSPLPVLTIGGRTAPLRAPQILRVRALPGGAGSLPDGRAPLIPGNWVALEGTALASDAIRIGLGDRTLNALPANIANGRIDVQLPTDIRAGLTRIAVEHLFVPEGSVDQRVWEMSNAAPLVISPVLNSHLIDGVVTDSRFAGTVTATLDHQVGEDQTAALLFNPLPGGPEQSFSVRCRARPAVGVEVVADLRGVVAANYLIRVEVDGAASQLTMGASGFDGPVADLTS